MTTAKPRRPQTLQEEIANSVTHGIGTGLSIAALALLVSLAAVQGDAWRIVSFSIYGASLVLLYLSSTLYHGFQEPKIKDIFHRFDHAAIFILIAGSYTPFTLVVMRNTLGWTIFGIVWSLTVLGIVFRMIFINRFRKLTVAIYLAMGWLILAAIKPIGDLLPTGAFVWLAAGGAAYSFGVVFYLWRKMHYSHLIWHIFVISGSVCHFLAILFYVLPAQTA